MKTSAAFLVLSSLFSVVAFANPAPMELAQYGRILIPKKDRSNIDKVADITILDNSTAQVKVTRYTNSRNVLSEETLNVDLPFATMETLRSSINFVSNIQTERTLTHVVCLMIPPFPAGQDLAVRRGYDSTTGTFQGELETVYRNNGCWDGLKIIPVDSYGLEDAIELRGKLKILITQLVSGK
jgi:hypothetical protein